MELEEMGIYVEKWALGFLVTCIKANRMYSYPCNAQPRERVFYL